MAAFTSPGALSGVRVLDLSRVLAGPFCTQILGDHGAEVIKVEPPQGDDTRRWGPPFAGDTAAYFIGLNRNKRGMALDLNEQAERDVLVKLLESADVLVENFKVGTLERWGIGPQDLAQRFPRLIHCRISGFGADGPLGGLPGYDAVIQAMCGLMSINGSADGPPVRMGVPVVDLATGLYAVIGILLALHERKVSGRGQFVDTALFDCGISLLHPHLANYLASGVLPTRTGNAHPNISPYDTYRTGTCDLFLAVGNDAQFRKLATALGLEDLPDDERFANVGLRNDNRDELRPILLERLATRSAQEWFEILSAIGIPCGPINDVRAGVELAERLGLDPVVSAGDVPTVRNPVRLSATPPRYDLAPPALDEHGAEIRAWLAEEDR